MTEYYIATGNLYNPNDELLATKGERFKCVEHDRLNVLHMMSDCSGKIFYCEGRNFLNFFGREGREDISYQGTIDAMSPADLLVNVND